MRLRGEGAKSTVLGESPMLRALSSAASTILLRRSDDVGIDLVWRSRVRAGYAIAIVRIFLRPGNDSLDFVFNDRVHQIGGGLWYLDCSLNDVDGR